MADQQRPLADTVARLQMDNNRLWKALNLETLRAEEVVDG